MAFPFRIRRATSADQPAVVAIARAFEADDWLIDAFDEMVDSESDPEGLYVAEQGDRVIACYHLEVPAPGNVYFSAMRVHPDFRGKGFGTQFCRAQVEQAREAAPGDIYLLSVPDNEPAHRTVMKNGFEAVGEWCAYLAVTPFDLGVPQRARRATREDLALLRAARGARPRTPMDGVIAAANPYVVRTFLESDLDPRKLAVVVGPAGLEGVIRFEVAEEYMLVSLLEGNPLAADDLLAFAAAEAAAQGVRLWQAGLPTGAEPLLRSWQVDPDTAWRALVFKLPYAKPLPDASTP